MFALARYVVPGLALVAGGLADTAHGTPPSGPVNRPPGHLKAAATTPNLRPNFTQNYITDPPNVQFTYDTDSFSVKFTESANFVVGKGWDVGSERKVSFEGDATTTGGTASSGLYGWFKDPLIEYYIVEYSSTPDPPTDILGRYQSDGGTYVFWKFKQVNAPSILGTRTFDQYVSWRIDKRPKSGVITTANHFQQWRASNLPLGTSHVNQAFVSEGFNKASGTAHYRVAEVP